MTIKLIPMILSAICVVESNNDSCAMGDWNEDRCDFDAIGAFQIHRAALQDVNRVYGYCYQHEEMLDYKKAYRVAGGYLLILTSRFIRKYGSVPTESELVMMYNGGSGTNFQNTGYLNKYNEVKKRIYEKEN